MAEEEQRLKREFQKAQDAEESDDGFLKRVVGESDNGSDSDMPDNIQDLG